MAMYSADTGMDYPLKFWQWTLPEQLISIIHPYHVASEQLLATLLDGARYSFVMILVFVLFDLKVGLQIRKRHAGFKYLFVVDRSSRYTTKRARCLRPPHTAGRLARAHASKDFAINLVKSLQRRWNVCPRATAAAAAAARKSEPPKTTRPCYTTHAILSSSSGKPPSTLFNSVEREAFSIQKNSERIGTNGHAYVSRALRSGSFILV